MSQESRAGKIYRIGILGNGPGAGLAQGSSPQCDGLRLGLRECGYGEGQHFTFEFRAGGRRLAEHAQELVDLGVDVIVAVTTTDAAVAKKTTTTIPIVFWSGDPVSSGLIQSLEHPGSNLTGVMAGVGSTGQVDLLREIIPGLSRVAILWNHTYAPAPGITQRMQEEAQSKGLQVQTIEVFDVAQIEAAFPAMVREQAQAVLISVH
jgi:putative ABC transport system substrate-binding protein